MCCCAGVCCCQVGVALKPSTPAELVLPYLQQGLLDMVSRQMQLHLQLTVGCCCGGRQWQCLSCVLPRGLLCYHQPGSHKHPAPDFVPTQQLCAATVLMIQQPRSASETVPATSACKYQC